MPKFSMILHVDEAPLYFVSESIEDHLQQLKKISMSAEKASVEHFAIEGINAFIITSHGPEKLNETIRIMEMFKNMSVSDIAKCMYFAIFKRINIFDTHKYCDRIHTALRSDCLNGLREKADADGLHYVEWQGFEFLLK